MNAFVTNSKLNFSNLDGAVRCLKRGGIIAYPTEAIYGLGCDPFNQAAVTRLRSIKNRSEEKGFILIASDWVQVCALVQPIDTDVLSRVLATWPGPITWIFPTAKTVPTWIRGAHDSIAIRVTAHPIAKALCAQYGGPIISTSANRENQEPIRDFEQLHKEFKKDIDLFVPGALGDAYRPSEMRNALTGEILRKG